MSHHPPIQVVNEQDEPVGGLPIAEVYERGLIHRVIHIIVEDQDGNILLQKRSANMVNDANLWDISVGGHVDEGEDYLVTAKRELHEELGLKNLDLIELDHQYKEPRIDDRQAKRFVKVYKTRIAHDTPITFPPDEISAIQWMTLNKIKHLIATQPVATGLRECIAEYY
jgi:isopentenyldiphosphate isomerase